MGRQTEHAALPREGPVGCSSYVQLQHPIEKRYIGTATHATADPSLRLPPFTLPRFLSCPLLASALRAHKCHSSPAGGTDVHEGQGLESQLLSSYCCSLHSSVLQGQQESRPRRCNENLGGYAGQRWGEGGGLAFVIHAMHSGIGCCAWGHGALCTVAWDALHGGRRGRTPHRERRRRIRRRRAEPSLTADPWPSQPSTLAYPAYSCAVVSCSSTEAAVLLFFFHHCA